MKITLKKLNINLTFSEETTMFNADVLVDGVVVASAKNDGHGGSTWYHAYEGKNKIVEKAEAYCKALPKDYSVFEKGFEQSLESVIDDLVNKAVEEKAKKSFNKKVEKAMQKNIVWGKPNGDSIRTWGFKTMSIEDILKRPEGKLQVETLYKKVKKELVDGEEIFNKNLVELFG